MLLLLLFVHVLLSLLIVFWLRLLTLRLLLFMFSWFMFVCNIVMLISLLFCYCYTSVSAPTALTSDPRSPPPATDSIHDFHRRPIRGLFEFIFHARPFIHLHLFFLLRLPLGHPMMSWQRPAIICIPISAAPQRRPSSAPTAPWQCPGKPPDPPQGPSEPS